MNINQLIELYAQTPTYFVDVYTTTLPATKTQSFRTTNEKTNCFIVPFSGEATITMDNTQYVTKNNNVFHCGPNAQCQIYVTSEKPFHYALIQYEVLRAENSLNIAFDYQLDDAVRCQHYVQQLVELAATPGNYALLQSHTIFMQFIEEFLASAKRTTLTPKSEVAAFAIAYMHEHYAKDLSIAQLAEHVGIERRRFSEVFEATTGMNPSQYLMELRIRKAKEELRADRESIAEVGEKVGYYDCFYFSRVFKKCTGMSPSTYRKKYRQLVTK